MAILLAILLLTVTPFQDQENTDPEKIEANIARATSLEEKYKALINACESLMYDDHDLVVKYGKEAALVARQLKNEPYEVRALARIAGAYMRKQEMEKATEFVNQAMAIAERNGHPDILFYAYWFKADLDFKIGQFEASIEGYLKAVDIIPETTIVPASKPLNVAIAYANIGEVYLALDQPEKSIEYSLASVKAAKNFTQYSHKIILIIQLINAYLSNADYDNAILYCNQALEIANKHNLKSSANRPRLLLVKALVGKYEQTSVPELLNQAETHMSQVNHDDLSPDYHQQYHLIKGILHLQQKNFDLAEAELNRSLSLAEDEAAALMTIEAHTRLADLYQQINKHNAGFTHLKESSALEKRLYRKKTNQAISRLSIRYDSIKKEKELQEERLRVQILQKNNDVIVALVWGLIIFAALVITVLILVYILYRNKKLTAAKLRRLSRRDPLTGLRNRRAIREDITNEIIRSKRSNKPFSFILGDIDHFKNFNDTYSHDCGDLILKKIANTLRNTVRLQDKICRWGGEEFLFVLPETDGESAMILAEKLREKIEKTTILWETKNLHVTISLGVSECNIEKGSKQGIRNADHAMYMSKKNGRNRVSYLG